MKNTLFAAAILAATLLLGSCQNRQTAVTSPDGKIRFEISMQDGAPMYTVINDGETVLDNSTLGFTLKGEDSPMSFTSVELIGRDSKDETWEQVWGEDRYVRNNYNEMTVRLREAGETARAVDIIVRVFDDGFGFRYSFPEQEFLEEFAIAEENTSFNLGKDLMTWWLDRSEPYYEAYGLNTPVSQVDTAQTPFTIDAGDGRYYAIHEANLTDYAKMSLTLDGEHNLRAVLTPWSDGTKVYAAAPCVTPWRTMIIADNIGELAASKIMLNLNEPCALEDVSWVKPGKYIGIWWTLHKDYYTWYYGPRHGATTEQTIRYIDFAAENGINGVLVEGWNKGWDGNWMKNSTGFSFTEAYPDYDFDKIMKHAAAKGVQMVIHNEYAANTEHYFSQIHDAYKLYSSYDMHYIKTGNVNLLMDGKEEHDGQYAVNRRRQIVETAAQYQICVDEHEPAMPTGIHRTYPNLMTYEGIRGQEHDAWEPEGGNKPEHQTVCPFIRGLAGPMDYTFGTFDFSNPNYPFCRVMTTLAKQLAQYVVIYSPLQMASDDPYAYEGKKAFDFIKDVPCDWHESHVLDAVIGDYVITARRDRNSEDWYLGGITDENARELTVSLSFLEPGTEYTAQIYADGPDASYEDNPESVTYSELTVTSADSLNMNLATSGGCAVRFVKK